MERIAKPFEKQEGVEERDWERIAYLMLLSRAMDNLEEREGLSNISFRPKGTNWPRFCSVSS